MNLKTALLAAVMTAAASSAVTAKSVRVAVAAWPPAMGNPFGQQIQGAVHPFPAMFDALTFMDNDGATRPRLALSWQADNPTTWTFKLRPDVKFMNGEPFNAAAVVAMIEMLKTPEGQRFFYASEVENIASVKAVDDLTVVFTTVRPDVILPKRLSLLIAVPPKYWADVGIDGFSQQPVGTGPFVLESWGRNRGYYALDAKSGSWRPAKHLDRMEFRILQESARRVQSLETGEVDIAYGVGFEDMTTLKAAGFPVTVRQVPTSLSIALPNTHANSPLNDVRVRQAMNYAIDRDSIARTIMQGEVQPSNHGIERGVFGYNPEIKPYPYDPAKARALLAEAGHAKGFTLDAPVITVATPDGAAIFQRVAQDLAAVGIKLELRSVLGAEWVQMWTSGDWKGADVISANWNGSTYMDAGRAIESYTCAKSGKPFFCAPEVEEMLAASNIEFDVKTREGQLQKALAMLHDLAPSIYLFTQTEIIATTPKISNIRFRGRHLDWDQLNINP